jgi:very-short-patch-repair endonuclease
MKIKTATVRKLRRKETSAEEAAWRLLRNRGCGGLKFRRQLAIENCVVDFFCFEERLAVELDGSVHSQPIQLRRDRAKDNFLKRLGIRVLRLPNGLVLENPDGFLEKVRRAALERLGTRSLGR